MKKRLIYIDFLKVLALLMVMCIHIVSPMWWHNSVYTESFAIANFFQGISRWAVPVFVMCTGAFLLDPNSKLETRKLMKKAAQMLLALLIFGMFYSIGFDLIEGKALSMSLISDALYNIYQVNAANHLWFIYMLIGLYLITPILRSYIKSASKANIEYFLLLWLIFGLTATVLLRLPGFRDIEPIINEMRINLVLGYSGYFIAGYYLKTYDLSTKLRSLIYLLGYAGLYVTIFSTYDRIIARGHVDLTYFRYTTINIALVAIALFVFAKHNINIKGRLEKPLTKLSSYTFGIFLTHGIFVYFVPKIYNLNFLYNNLWLTPLVAVIVYSLTFIIVYLLCKIPHVDRILK